ncbi:hypothetical protein BJV82DRAFT_573775 [Fennellomyces sp. T-0311]|nr:hypothetical protein BJV82DRAFT_573775 [Fennellomyces sp. T-0311]
MFRILSLLLFVLIALLDHAHGYCVYNRHSDGTSFFIRQIAGQGPHAKLNARFKKWNVTPDQSECCSYQDNDCAANGNAEDIVKFWIVLKSDQGFGVGNYEIDCPAGGYIVLSGTSTQPIIDVRWADGRPYQYTVEHDQKSHWFFADLKKTRKMENRLKSTRRKRQFK